MKQDNNSKKSGKNFYTVLCCCIAAIGIVGYISSVRTREYKTSFNADNVSVPEMPTLPAIKKTEPELPSPTAKPTPVPTQAPPETPAPASEADNVIESGENPEFYDGNVIESVSIVSTPEFIFPVEGEICRGFSGNTLYYDNLLGDFRTHDGIDIKAQPDNDIAVSFDGTIEEIYEDSVGKTVIINHNNGYKTKYSNLDDTENLEIGMNMKKGDFLAHVGTNPMGEPAEDTYIHFEIIKDQTPVNPEDYLK